MPNGQPKPLALLQRHATKEEIAFRKEQEEAMYTGLRFRESDQVRVDAVAHKEFNRLRKLYKKIKCVDALDEQVINRYCLEISKRASLEATLELIKTDLTNCTDFEQRIELYRSINANVNILEKQLSLLIMMEDRLLMNPVSRVRAIPKTPPKKTEPATGMEKFLKDRNITKNA